MPTRPKAVTLTAKTENILNSIRNNASFDYQKSVPIATPENIKEIGNIIYNLPALKNEFLNTLINRIGLVIVTSKTYQNPLRILKKGVMEFGESIEEIFVNLAKAFEFDETKAESELFKREIPDVRTAFHVINYQKFYKVTVSDRQLRKAFLNYAGVTELIADITEQIYTAHNYDEFLVTKYMLARAMLSGYIHAEQIDSITTANMHSIVSSVKAVSNKFEFMNSTYNYAGVKNHSLKNEQYFIVNSEFDAKMDVEVLASAFNMSKAEFLGNRILIDDFSELDIERLNELMKDDANYVEISKDELAALKQIPIVLVDKDFIQIYDNLLQFTEQYNSQGLYWNYFYHVWKIFSYSPFANACLFVPGTITVDSISITPTEISVTKGTSFEVSVNVKSDSFADLSYTLTSDSEFLTINGNVVTVSENATPGTVNLKATSNFDSTKTATCVVTIQ